RRLIGGDPDAVARGSICYHSAALLEDTSWPRHVRYQGRAVFRIWARQPNTNAHAGRIIDLDAKKEISRRAPLARECSTEPGRNPGGARRGFLPPEAHSHGAQPAIKFAACPIRLRLPGA
ncbi:unnamed protein product, partial [Amoebophrya sp. A120]